MKYIDTKEFINLGFLQEANRLFFHPHGLALEVSGDDVNGWTISGIWDYRDDPEGICFADLSQEESKEKFASVLAQRQKHLDARCKMFNGESIQPVGDKMDD